MLSLNLLPPSEKALLFSRFALRKIMAWSILFLLSACVFFALLASVWLYVEIQLRSVDDILAQTESGQRGQAYHTLRDQISRANRNLQQLSQVQKEIKFYSPGLEGLAGLVPLGISFNRVSLVKNDLSLEGHAYRRDDLLFFKENLEKSIYFKVIENPVSNLLKQSSIDFSFKIKMNQ